MRIVFKGPISPYSGYGQDGIGFLSAMINAGHDVFVIPTALQPPLPKEIAMLLTKPLEAPFDLLINHTDPGQLGVTGPERYASKFVVGQTMWEYDALDNLENVDSVQRNLTPFDALFSYDPVTHQALDPHVGRDTAHFIVQGGYTAEDWPLSTEREWFNGPIRFCMVGALHERKDPFVALEAFRRLKEDKGDDFDAQLYMKNNIPSLAPQIEDWIPGVKIICETWPQAKVLDFLSVCHVLLAPSRGEGKNMPALQMLSTGGTVVATNWGGHTMWLTPSLGYPLDYVLKPAEARFKAQNARASTDHLMQIMWDISTNRAEARLKGERGATTIPAQCDWSKVLERVLDKVRELKPRNNDRRR